MKSTRTCSLVGLAAILAVTELGASANAQSCQQLSGVFAATLSASTTGAVNHDVASCGGADAPDITFFYVAPRAGTYTIDTIGSNFDTVLSVRDAGGAEVACNDDIIPGGDTQSRTLPRDQPVHCHRRRWVPDAKRHRHPQHQWSLPAAVA